MTTGDRTTTKSKSSQRNHQGKKTHAGLTYADSGVDIEAGDRMVGMIQQMMRRTHGPRVIDVPGGFANMFRLDYNEKLFRKNFRDPVLVACTDGVGTKVKLAIELGVFDSIGIDCVAMCVNDLIVQGAEPLFFLDYLAVNKLDPDVGTQIVRGVSAGCEWAECALIGGETAEMSDLYAPGDFDLAGFAVGVVELERAIDTSRVEVGDIVIGLASDGVHSNGFSLVRRIIKKKRLNLNKVYPELFHPPMHPDEAKEWTLGDHLLIPTRIYARPIVKLLNKYRVKKVVSGMAHITGGGLPGNIDRALHDEVDAVIDRGAWTVPPVFGFLQERGSVDEEEMMRVFNMGIGYVLIVRPTFAESIQGHLARLGEKPRVIGEIKSGTGKVNWA